MNTTPADETILKTDVLGRVKTPKERREQLLDIVRLQGYSDGYKGIRISSSGRRFEIRNAVIWSVVDSAGKYAGQAAMFPEWRFL